VSRIPELERYQLSPEQTKVYDAILASRGSLRGPFRAWLHSPRFAQRAQELGEQVRFHTTFPARLRELAILVTARFWDAQLEWSIHEPLAREAGLARSAIEDVKRRRTPGLEQRDEAAVYRYTSDLLRDHFVDDNVFTDASEHLGNRGLTELTILIGYYSLVALSLNAFGVGVPPDMRPLLPDAPGVVLRRSSSSSTASNVLTVR
jgi:4-carboxymuconolactone decarboxylase